MTITATRPAASAALDRVNDLMRPMARGLAFGPDDTGNTVLRVLDVQTNEVLRQLPSNEAIAIARALDRLQGLFVQAQA